MIGDPVCNLLNFDGSCSQQDKGHFETGRGIIDSNLIHSTDLSLVIVMGRVQNSSGSGRLEDLAFGFGFLISKEFFARV